VFTQLNFAAVDAGDDNYDSEAENLSPFVHLARDMEDLTGESGVLKRIIRPGAGPVVPEEATVRVHYNAYLEYNDEPYDSSRLRNQPEQLKLGQGGLLGFEIAVSSMKRSEISRFLIKPDYAFGRIGCPPRIPPNATLLFEIELISFIDSKAADDFDSFSEEDRRQTSVEQLIEVCHSEREIGNDFFQRQQYGRAMTKYSRAIRLLENARIKNEEEERLWKDSLTKLYLNMSLCCLKKSSAPRAISFANKVLDFDSKNVKAIFRLGQAYMMLSEFKRARDKFVVAIRLAPNSEDIRRELLKLDQRVEKFRAMERSMCAKMFPDARKGLPDPLSNKTAGAASDMPRDHRNMIQQTLQYFKDDSGVAEFAFPSSLSSSEVACIKEVAWDLGLQTKVTVCVTKRTVIIIVMN
jgi:FK506-binding protein 6